VQSTLSAVETVAFWMLTGMLGLAAVTLQLSNDNSFPLAVAHALAGYLWLAVVPLILWSAVASSRSRVVATVVVFACTLAWVTPGHLPTHPRGEPELRLASANVLMIHQDPNRVIADLVEQDPDLIVLQEISHEWADAIERSAALEPWPHRLIHPQIGSFGVAVLSKVPLPMTLEELAGIPMAKVELTLNGQRIDVYDVHTLPPRSADYAAIWSEQMTLLADRVQSSPVPVILAGDFNATRHHPSYKRLTQAGVNDAHAQVGRASAKTWPNGVFPVPSLRLDHVLVGDGIAVHAVVEGPANGSDHKPLFVDLGWNGPLRGS
jgi:endonuclease/exonuclease/phosphatase (EEP) superfamily protein YafD